MNKATQTLDYQAMLQQIKQRVAVAQQKIAILANAELQTMYWDIGKILDYNQKLKGWGERTIHKLAQDMKNEYPTIKGFSFRNCSYMIQFYREYPDGIDHTHLPGSNGTILPIAQLTWTHNIRLIQKIKDWNIRYWYMVETLKNHWESRMLERMIDEEVHKRHGILPNNFQQTLPPIQAKQVREILKDPYLFDMLTLRDDYEERDIELGLIKQIEKFLLELGAGFAFVGRQYHIAVDQKDYYIDLLLYHIPLHCYIVVELKNVEFQAEFAGKVNFYCNAIDNQLKGKEDKPTVGLILCKTKSRITVEYAINNIQKPIGVSEFRLPKTLPISQLPKLEDLEEQLNQEFNSDSL